MTAPYHLVPNLISPDTVEAHAQMAIGASDGEVVGSANILFLRNRRYSVSVTGVARRNATLARGCLAVLDDQLADLIHHRDPGETR